MKLTLKTRDNWREEYLYEVHRAGCADLKKDATGVWETDKFGTPDELIKADMEDDIPRDNYKVMPCVK